MILLIEDNEADADAVIKALAASGSAARIVSVPRLSEGLARIKTSNIGAVILDLSLPDASGLSGLRRIRAVAPALPVLVLTGTRDDHLCAQALHEGAQEYLVKGDLDGPSVAQKIRDSFGRQSYSTRASVVAEEQARAALADERRASWLAEAGRLLSLSLDYQTTLENIRRAIVPAFADACVIGLVGSHLIAAVPEEPVTAQQAARIEEVVRTGRAWFDELAGGELFVPMTIGDRRVGALALRRYESRGVFSPAERLLGGELGHRAALALENAALYQKAQAAIGLRDDFLSIASHELRTPLSALQLQIQLLQLKFKGTAPPSGEQAAEGLANCLAQTRRISRLVDTLLDVSLIASGQLALRCEEIDLRGLVDETLDRLRSASSDGVSNLHFEHGDRILGRCDRLRLEQVVTNLITNGLKYGGGKAVRVNLHSDRTHARLTVRDGGIGIAPEDLPRIFGRFERAAPSRQYSGLGLGLYVTRQIVEAHGGTIAVESQQGIGSVFTVTLPLDACVPQANTALVAG